MENTIIIGYAGGYCEIRLNHTEYGVTLEYLEMNEDHSDYVPNPTKPIQTFDTAAEAWIAVGKEIGWISGQATLWVSGQKPHFPRPVGKRD